MCILCEETRAGTAITASGHALRIYDIWWRWQNCGVCIAHAALLCSRVTDPPPPSPPTIGFRFGVGVGMREGAAVMRFDARFIHGRTPVGKFNRISKLCARFFGGGGWGGRRGSFVCGSPNTHTHARTVNGSSESSTWADAHTRRGSERAGPSVLRVMAVKPKAYHR